MTCRLFAAKPLFEPMLVYCQMDPQEQISVTFYQKPKLLIHENASDNIVCEMAPFFFQGEMS